MATLVKFKGTIEETADLLNAIVRNCTCELDPEMAMPRGTCPAHHLLSEQRSLDGLLVSRQRTAELVREELS